MERATPLIYVVEDDAQIRAIFEELLCDGGYSVLGCPTAHEAQYLIGIEPPDLMLLDIHLEQYGAGWTLLTQLRADAATATLPIIVISADAQFLRMRNDELLAKRCFIIEKPFDLDDVLTTVYAAIGVAPLQFASPDKDQI